MKPSANTQITAMMDAARDMFVVRPQRMIAQWRGKLNDLSGTNYEMGNAFAAQGAMRDAAMRFRIAVKIDPNFTQAWYNLGVALMQLGDKEKAADAFQQAVLLDDRHEEAAYLLAAMNPALLPRDRWPTRMPRLIVEKFFAASAAYYAEMETQNRYNGPALCEQKSLQHLAKKTELQILDLGCGTGLASRPWRSKASRIVGVDMVEAMVAQARAATFENKNLFEEVIAADLHATQSIAVAPASVDLVLLCNVAQFVGDLNHVLRAASGWLKADGIVTLTVEPAMAGSAYGVNPATGKFGHSAAYLQDVAKAAGLSVVLQERVNLYPDVVAGLVVMRKQA
ncbi:MAG: methyltransferase domain-containing protein [Alphaproteobacteria bacterium]|nr:methyltransferase domain-containing protein [Alphaproteobacteria bacterium]